MTPRHPTSPPPPPPPPPTHSRLGAWWRPAALPPILTPPPHPPHPTPHPQSAGRLVEACRAAGLLVITAGKGDIVRLVPPLVVSEAEIATACSLLAAAAAEVLE